MTNPERLALSAALLLFICVLIPPLYGANDPPDIVLIPWGILLAASCCLGLGGIFWAIWS